MTNMSRYVPPCPVEGCNRNTHGRSRYCAKHEYRDHSHGHPLQLPMTLKIKEPVQRLRRWGKTPEGKRVIDIATEHYTHLAERKQEEASAAYREMLNTGIKIDRPYNQATEIISEVAASKDHRKTVIELMALGILLEETPQSFKSDRAILCEATHVFIRGSTARASYRYYAKRGTRIAVTRYLRRETRNELGRWLMTEMVTFGVALYRQWMKAAAEQKMQKNKVYAAIAASTETSA